MNPSHEQWLKRLFAAMEIPVPDPLRQLRRITVVERNIVLPVKVVFIAMIGFSFNMQPWFGNEASTMEVVVETVQYSFWVYVALSILVAIVLALAERLPLAVLQWTVVADGMLDGLLIAGLALISGGLDSIMFWLFVALIIRNASSIPPGVSQLILNFATSLCYALVALLDVAVLKNLDDTTLRTLDLAGHEDLGQPFALRLLVLGLTTLCCYGAQILLERQRLAVEEATEFAAREGQLHSAGRLAAEFAHQIKNPLAVISNSAHSLQRALRDHKPASAEQIEIIQEEVARADKVVTQIMGYAQLSEGRVEKLNVTDEIARAIARVFPAALPTRIKVYRADRPPFPPLLMQSGHLAEILTNLLQNSRDALGNSGKIFVTTTCLRDMTVEITIRDDGPGIAPEKLNRIFEAYYTTKEKGSGLGLAIVKHNVELYGGTIQVESELGKGVKFTINFPAKALPRPFSK
ncbi:MAG TPA: HAMP domain-containing sensor histidine kinase [Candidatus Acidoferrum sp.]|nr:HAMP domain-containing sensor histidine kinase [Candidatus Acidoferrum sp.]